MSRRGKYEVIVDPKITRPQVRKRVAVIALFAPDWASAADLLLEHIRKDEG